jgi:hypothetical protein
MTRGGIESLLSDRTDGVSADSNIESRKMIHITFNCIHEVRINALNCIHEVRINALNCVHEVRINALNYYRF